MFRGSFLFQDKSGMLILPFDIEKVTIQSCPGVPVGKELRQKLYIMTSVDEQRGLLIVKVHRVKYLSYVHEL